MPPCETMFQSTHLHEVRHNVFADLLRPACFNPRTYMRCDDGEGVSAACTAVFQSTHLHEVRLTLRRFNYKACKSFNPRTYMRCD